MLEAFQKPMQRIKDVLQAMMQSYGFPEGDRKAMLQGFIAKVNADFDSRIEAIVTARQRARDEAERARLDEEQRQLEADRAFFDDPIEVGLASDSEDDDDSDYTPPGSDDGSDDGDDCGDDDHGGPHGGPAPDIWDEDDGDDVPPLESDEEAEEKAEDGDEHGNQAPADLWHDVTEAQDEFQAEDLAIDELAGRSYPLEAGNPLNVYPHGDEMDRGEEQMLARDRAIPVPPVFASPSPRRMRPHETEHVMRQHLEHGDTLEQYLTPHRPATASPWSIAPTVRAHGNMTVPRGWVSPNEPMWSHGEQLPHPLPPPATLTRDLDRRYHLLDPDRVRTVDEHVDAWRTITRADRRLAQAHAMDNEELLRRMYDAPSSRTKPFSRPRTSEREFDATVIDEPVAAPRFGTFDEVDFDDEADKIPDQDNVFGESDDEEERVASHLPPKAEFDEWFRKLPPEEMEWLFREGNPDRNSR
jgi:hypothetical protein